MSNVKLQHKQDIPTLNEKTIDFFKEIQNNGDGYYHRIMLRAVYTLSGLIEETLPISNDESTDSIKRRNNAYMVLPDFSRVAGIIDSFSK